MATQAEVITNFIDPLKVHYRLPPDAEPFIRDLIEAIRGYRPETLLAAKSEIIRTRRYKTFPGVPECLGTCARFEGVGAGTHGITAETYHKAALSVVKANGKCVMINPKDHAPEWAAWRKYYEQIGEDAMLGVMLAIEEERWAHDKKAVPTLTPREFDPNAPSVVSAVAA